MPPITVFCPFTRPEYVRRWFDDLASTDLKAENTNLALTIDVGEDDYGQNLGAKIYDRIITEMQRTHYRKYLITRNYDHKVPGSIVLRRRRIAEVHNQSKEMIIALDGKFVLGLEDDTVFTNLCVERLYRKFVENEDTGLVSAYEAGRWNMKIIGIWGFDDVKNPRVCWTELPGKDYEEIDAAGMYCYLTPTTLYLKHHYTTEDVDPYGPDVRYGLDLRQQGYKNYVDWSQPCGHIDGDRIITPNDNLYVEEFTFDNKLKGWLRKKQDALPGH